MKDKEVIKIIVGVVATLLAMAIVVVVVIAQPNKTETAQTVKVFVPHSPVQWREYDYSSVVIEGCEYLVISGKAGAKGITHKGNCRRCTSQPTEEQK